MYSIWVALCAIIAFTNYAYAGDKVLVLVDNMAIKETHSLFLKSLEERGHTLQISMADDASLSLIKYGKFLYQHLIIFAPSVEEFGGSISVPEIASFIDGGGNVLVAAGSNLGEGIRDLATEVGFEFDESSTQVIDHHNYDSVLDQGYHTTIVVPGSQLIGAELIAGNKAKISPVLFRGISLVSDATNKLRLEVMTAATTAYSFNPTAPIDEYPAAVGKSVILVGAVQARNNARVVLTGSLDMFSNAFINANVNKAGSADKPIKSGNLDFVTSLSKWVLKEAGVLRVQSVKHHIVGETKPPHEYTIGEQVSYQIDIEELQNGKWVPFQGKDVQLEFVRIDPFVRTTLQNNNGKLSTVFKVPDVYGVYKFLVDYRRVGYTHLYDVQQVSVRPLKHNQYQRFLTAAYPYYVSAFSMMAGVFIFSFVFLYYKEAPGAASTAPVTKITGKTSNHSRSRRKASPSPPREHKKKSRHKHKKVKKSKSRDRGSSHRASGHSHESEPESSVESATSATKHISKKKHKWAKESKKSRWEALPPEIITDYRQDNDPFRPLTDFVGDRLKLAKEVLKSVNMATVNEILPEFKDSADEEREKVIHEMLKFMSRKRIIAILKCQDLSDSSTTNTDEGCSSAEEKNESDFDEEEAESMVNKRNIIKTRKLSTKEKRRKKHRQKSVFKDPEELEDGEIRSGSEESGEKKTQVEAHSTNAENPSTSQSHPLIEGRMEMSNVQAVSPSSSLRSISSDREIADSTASDNQQHNEDAKEAEHPKESLDSRQSLPQQVSAISTTTTDIGIEGTDEENESEEYPEYPDFELE